MRPGLRRIVAAVARNGEGLRPALMQVQGP